MRCFHLVFTTQGFLAENHFLRIDKCNENNSLLKMRPEEFMRVASILYIYNIIILHLNKNDNIHINEIQEIRLSNKY